MSEQTYPLTVTSIPRILAFTIIATVFTASLFLFAQLSGKIEGSFVALTVGALVLIITIISAVWWKERNINQ